MGIFPELLSTTSQFKCEVPGIENIRELGMQFQCGDLKVQEWFVNVH
jgi:hypothetical protein